MYTAYCDGKVFYSPILFHQGLAITNPKIIYEINKAGSFTFTLPPNNPMYNSFKKLKSIITVNDGDTEIWRGRVLDTTRTFFNQKEVVCEGELAFLNDTLIPPYDFSKDGITIRDLFVLYFQHYRDNLVVERDIQLGLITAVNSSTVIYPKNDSYRSLLDDVMVNVVQPLGGHLQIRREKGISYLDYLNTKLNLSDQRIEFGRNLIDLEEYIDASEIYTYLIPFGKKDENGNPLTIESVNDGKNYIHSEIGFNLYGKIEKSITWDNITDPSLLKSTAQEELDEAIKESLSITINAVDLKYLGINVTPISVGQYMTVVSQPHSIHDNFLCSKIQLDLAQPGNSTYTLGGTAKALTTTQAETVKSISNQRITTDWLQAAIDDATAMMTGSRGGYKVTEYDEDGKWLRDLYMNAPNKEDATQVMQINMNGIGFSRDGFDGPYKNAWTIDGTLLGEFLKAGSIQAEALSAEYKSLVTDEINSIATAKFEVADQRISAEVTRASNAEDLLAASINVQADKIEQRVSKGEFGTYVQQYYDRVLIGFNTDSKYVQIDAGAISIYDNGIEYSKQRSKFDQNGNHFYRDGYYVGKIGTNRWADNNTHKGLVFDLAYQGKYMAWAYEEYDGAPDYTTIWGFSRVGSIYSEFGLHAGCDIYMHNWTLHNVSIDGLSTDGYNGWTGSIPIITSITDNGDGSISWTYSSITVRNGIITSAPR